MWLLRLLKCGVWVGKSEGQIQGIDEQVLRNIRWSLRQFSRYVSPAECGSVADEASKFKTILDSIRSNCCMQPLATLSVDRSYEQASDLVKGGRKGIHEDQVNFSSAGHVVPVKVGTACS